MHRYLYLVFLTLFTSLASAQNYLNEDELNKKAIAFIKASEAREQPGSNTSDIDHFLSLLTDNFVDEHVLSKITIRDKAELRRGMIAKLQDEIIYLSKKIEEIVLVKNVAVIKLTTSAKAKPSHLEHIIEHTYTELISLEFDENGLVKHIRRFHG